MSSEFWLFRNLFTWPLINKQTDAFLTVDPPRIHACYTCYFKPWRSYNAIIKLVPNVDFWLPSIYVFTVYSLHPPFFVVRYAILDFFLYAAGNNLEDDVFIGLNCICTNNTTIACLNHTFQLSYMYKLGLILRCSDTRIQMYLLFLQITIVKKLSNFNFHPGIVNSSFSVVSHSLAAVMVPLNEQAINRK